MKHKQHKKFSKAYERLDPTVQDLVDQTLEKPDEWLQTKGSHFEPLGKGDNGWWSFRVNDGFRIIAAKYEDDIVLYWIDQHDDSYRWEKRHKFEKNPLTKELQYYGLPENDGSSEQVTSGPFAQLDSRDLLYFGVPTHLHEHVRGLPNVASIDEDVLPENAIEHLTYYADPDFSDYEVYEIVASYNNSMAQASGMGLSSCLVEVDSETELKEALASGMEDWRIFLHPTQIEVATGFFPGSAKVVGGAGTGKTVVAMHRAKHLAKTCVGSNDRVLLTVFNTGLTSYVSEQFAKLCEGDEELLDYVDIDNIDNVAKRVFDCAGMEDTPCRGSDDMCQKRWRRAIELSGAEDDPGWSPEWGTTFLDDEWRYVILQHGVTSLDDYKMIGRVGRGRKLGAKERELIWRVIESYIRDEKENNRYDMQHFIQKAADYLAAQPEGSEKRLQYKYVIVDEMQDMSAPALRLVRQLAGQEHANDIMLLGDARQRIYMYRGSLKACGIRILPSFSKCLYRNYRTTAEIEDFAKFVLGEAWMEEAIEDVENRQSVSLLSGKEPEVKVFSGRDEEAAYIAETILELNRKGIPLETMCVVARTNKLAKEYSGLLKSHGIDNKNLKGEEIFPGDGCVSVSTMHHAKGLEYDIVFLAGVSQDIPLRIAGQEEEYAQEEAKDFPTERSLLYMCITRAKQRVYITSPSELSTLLSFCVQVHPAEVIPKSQSV